MKRSYILLGLIVAGYFVANNAMENRPEVYKQIDNCMKSPAVLMTYGNIELKIKISWPCVFRVLKSMPKNVVKTIIDQYRLSNLYNYTLLEIAVLTDDVEAVRTLLKDYKAKPNIKDNQGNTAFIQACRNNKDPKIVQLLLENGADPYLKNKNGDDSFDLVKNNLAFKFHPEDYKDIHTKTLDILNKYKKNQHRNRKK